MSEIQESIEKAFSESARKAAIEARRRKGGAEQTYQGPAMGGGRIPIDRNVVTDAPAGGGGSPQKKTPPPVKSKPPKMNTGGPRLYGTQDSNLKHTFNGAAFAEKHNVSFVGESGKGEDRFHDIKGTPADLKKYISKHPNIHTEKKKDYISSVNQVGKFRPTLTLRNIVGLTPDKE